jgi:hypothetical protein
VAAAVALAPVLAAASESMRGLSAKEFFFALWATVAVSAVVRFASFRCPYCTQPFHWTWIVANPFSRTCLHCGFAKWRDPDAARAYGARASDR